MLDPHGGEDNGKLFRLRGRLACGSAQGRLAHDLGGELIMGQTGAGEERQFLASQEGVHTVNRRDACLDIVARVHARSGIDRLPVDIGVVLRQGLGPAILWQSQSAKDAPQHLFSHRDLERLPQKVDARPVDRKSSGAGEHLDHSHIFSDLKHAALADHPLRVDNFHHVVITHASGILDHHNRAFDPVYSDDFIYSQIQ